MSPVLAAAIKAAVLPPGLNLLLLIVGLLLLPWRRRLSVLVITFSILLLYVLSTTIAAKPLARVLEGRAPALNPELAAGDAGAIVVPGCDRYSAAPEFGRRDEVSACTLVRLRYAADLHAHTNVPLLLSGGSPFGEQIPEARLMDRVLRERFGTAAEWLETESRNTAENAELSARMLKLAGVKRIYLVTHALHMERARRSFGRHGLEVIPAPTYFLSTPDDRPQSLQFLPSAGALMISNQTIYELLGLAWYATTER